jgi:hypothetical protein
MNVVMEFWCFIDVPLANVFKRFTHVFPSNARVHDAENVWEWIDGRSDDGRIGFNISRAHDDRESNPDEPVRLSLGVDPSCTYSRDAIGQNLANALGTKVFTGTIEYLGSDDFRFAVERTFEPLPANKPAEVGTGKSVKIKTLAAPSSPLVEFDPGSYLSGLEFYETQSPISEEDRDALAQFTHFLAFLALQAKSSNWTTSVVTRDSLAYRALESHFHHLNGWNELGDDQAISYRQLASFLMSYYPPHAPGR